MKKKLITLTLIAFSLNSLAQSEGEEKYPINRLAIKWSPLHALDFFSTFQVALEQRIAKNVSLQYDFGVVIPIEVDRSTYHDQHGYKAKIQLRFYIPSRTKHWAFYYGPEFYYNRVDYQKSETYYLGSQGFYQFIAHDMEYREKGIALKVGTLFRARRFCLDFQIGAAGRLADYKALNVPPYELIPPHRPFFDIGLRPDERRNIKDIIPVFGIRVGYVLLK